MPSRAGEPSEPARRSTGSPRWQHVPAMLRALTALTLDSLCPVPLDGLAAHPAAAVGQAAALCWGRR